jgi:hypothetical protein
MVETYMNLMGGVHQVLIDLASDGSLGSFVLVYMRKNNLLKTCLNINHDQ